MQTRLDITLSLSSTTDYKTCSQLICTYATKMFTKQGDKRYEAVTCRDGFTVLLMGLKLQGSSLTQALSKALEKP